MGGGFPGGIEVANALTYGATGNSGTVITGSATINTKGSWVQLTASSGTDAVAMLVNLEYYAGTTQNAALDIGIGPAGSEQVIVSNLLCAGPTSSGTEDDMHVLFPISIPAGTRIAARTQSTLANDANLVCSITLFDGSFTAMDGSGGVDSVGFVSTSTLGTLVTAAAGAKGSYFQLTSATARDYIGFFLNFDTQNAVANASYQADIAVGASGSEIIILPDYVIWVYANVAGLRGPHSPFIPIPIPAGTRIAARAQENGSTSFGITLYGVYG